MLRIVEWCDSAKWLGRKLLSLRKFPNDNCYRSFFMGNSDSVREVNEGNANLFIPKCVYMHKCLCKSNCQNSRLQWNRQWDGGFPWSNMRFTHFLCYTVNWGGRLFGSVAHDTYSFISSIRMEKEHEDPGWSSYSINFIPFQTFKSCMIYASLGFLAMKLIGFQILWGDVLHLLIFILEKVVSITSPSLFLLHCVCICPCTYFSYPLIQL